jgi:hypothetical protein
LTLIGRADSSCVDAPWESECHPGTIDLWWTEPTIFVFALWAAYIAVLYSVVQVTALWTVWGAMDARRSWLLSLAVGAAATLAQNPFVMFAQPELLRTLVSVSGSWLAVALAAAVMRAWGWRFCDTSTPFDVGGGARHGQYGLRHLLVVTVVLAIWLAALRWVYITGGDEAAPDGNLGTTNSLLLIVMLILNAPQVLIAAVTIGRGRRVMLGLVAVLSLSAAGLLILVGTYFDRSDFGLVLPLYVSYTFGYDVTQFLSIGLGMRWLRKRGYRLERSKARAALPTNDAEQRMDGYE